MLDSVESVLTLNDYQNGALCTAVYPVEQKIIYPSLGLSGESGEVADKVKKVLRDNGGVFDEERRRAIALELGDVLWYVSVLSHDIGYDLYEIANMNLAKLRSRQERGKISGSGDYR